MIRRALGAAGATLLVLGCLEGAVRLAYGVRNAALEAVPLPYVVGHGYGPPPPWLDEVRILEPDERLLWRGQPGVRQRYVDIFAPARAESDRIRLLRRFLPGAAEVSRGRPTWDVALNSEGFRDVEFPTGRDAGSARIVCLGDSWTFGANVAPDESYPSQLAELLLRRRPGSRIEVLNLGVLGYSTYQGRLLLESRALALAPDVLVIGFGMNDASVAGYQDAELASRPREQPTPVSLLASALERVELLELLRYGLAVARFVPRTPGDALADADRADAAGPVDYATLEPWTRVPPAHYEANLQAMVARARAEGVEVVLLYPALFDLDPALSEQGPYRSAIGRVARETRAPLVDGAAVVARARSRVQARRARAAALLAAGSHGPGPPDGARVVLRVHAAGHSVPEALYVTGVPSGLGAGVPNALALRDDGALGDERAGDGIWSLGVLLSPSRTYSYVYTNSGRRGHWEGLDVPAVRRLTLSEESRGSTLYRPVETFGAIDLQADPWHTDARGYRLIAEAVADTLAGSAAWPQRSERSTSLGSTTR